MSEGRIRARLAELGLTLHGPHPPHDPLDAVVVHDGVARTSSYFNMNSPSCVSQ